MKRKLLLLSMLTIARSVYLDASSGGYPMLKQKKETAVQGDQALALRAATGAPSNASGAAIEGVSYDRTAFVPLSNMLLPITYLSAANNFTGNAAPFALARAFVDEAGKVRVNALADKARLNGTDVADSPLKGKAITGLSLMGGSSMFGSTPVIIAPTPGTNPTSPDTIYLLTDPQPGMVTMLSNNDKTIKDAAGNDVDNSIAAIAASSKYIFAAVPQAGATFSAGDDRGIAVLAPDGNKLKVLDATNFSGTTVKAQKIDTLASTGLMAFGAINNATLGPDVDMFYDPVLHRLYGGFSNVKRDTTGSSGGVLGVVVGRVEQNQFSLASIVNGVSAALFADNGTNSIIGLYSTDNEDIPVSIKKPRVMHTSTGKHYLIVQSAVNNLKGVYALPLIGNDTGVDSALVGTIAAVDTNGVSKCDNKAPTIAAELISAIQTPAQIDKPLPACSPNIEALRDIYVEGDSVFLAYAGNAKSASAGIYRATALFNSEGAIRAWTPLTRVAGDVRRTLGVGVDNQTGSLHFVTPATQSGLLLFDTVRVTQWGKSDDVATVGDTQSKNNLTSLLNEIFPKETCRVHQLCAFDEFTPGFVPCQFSMMVALGKDTVALIQTGKRDADNNFLPVQEFKLNENVFVFKGGVLDDIGPLSCCQLSRSSNRGEGWLYVGGYRGVAVLSADDGTGYTDLANLTAAGYPGNGFSFKKLVPSNNSENGFWNVRSLQMDADTLIVATQRQLYAVGQDEAKFTATNPASLDETLIPLPNELADECISDMVIVPDMILLGMTSGLFAFDGVNIHEVTVDGQSLGPVVQLQYFSQTKGINSDQGNLYVLASDITTGMGKMYRFDIDDLPTNLSERVIPIKVRGVAGPFMNFGEFRGNFVTDGSVFFHSLSKHLRQNRFLELRPITHSGSNLNITSLLKVDQACEFTVGPMIQEPAFGSWIVPGDWGVRVNQ